MSTRMTSMGILTWFFCCFCDHTRLLLLSAWIVIIICIHHKRVIKWYPTKVEQTLTIRCPKWQLSVSGAPILYKVFNFTNVICLFLQFFDDSTNKKRVKHQKTQIIRETRDVQWIKTLKRTKCIIIQGEERERKITHYLARLLQTCFY